MNYLKKHIGNIVIFWCIMVSLTYMIIGGDESMEIGSWVALIVAIIGVASGIWMQVIQFRKDAQRIDGVNKTSENIKNDTTKMKPKIDEIKNTTKETNDSVTKHIQPNINHLLASVQGELKDKITLLSDDLKLRQRLESEYKGIRSRTMIEGGIKELYEENAILTVKNRELNEQVEHLTLENEQYRTRNIQLEEKIQELESYRQPQTNQIHPEKQDLKL